MQSKPLSQAAPTQGANCIIAWMSGSAGLNAKDNEWPSQSAPEIAFPA
jgi:hypothetical protein